MSNHDIVLSSFVWNRNSIRRLRRLEASGITYREIGIRMGVSKNTIGGRLKRMKIIRRKSPARLALQAELFRLWQLNTTVRDAVRLTGASRNAVNHWFNVVFKSGARKMVRKNGALAAGTGTLPPLPSELAALAARATPALPAHQ